MRRHNMKVRDGFESNSSSSSFVFREGHPYKNVFELALVLIPCREWDNDEDLVQKVRDELENKNGRNPNTPVMFRSCNEDTYILRVDPGKDKDKYFVVSTCHNHVWVREDEIGIHDDIIPALKKLAEDNPRLRRHRGSFGRRDKENTWYGDGHNDVWEWIGMRLPECAEFWDVENNDMTRKGED
jgi:hypothetical protein